LLSRKKGSCLLASELEREGKKGQSGYISFHFFQADMESPASLSVITSLTRNLFLPQKMRLVGRNDDTQGHPHKKAAMQKHGSLIITTTYPK